MEPVIHYSPSPKVRACRWFQHLLRGQLTVQPDAVTCYYCKRWLKRREITREQFEQTERWEQ